MGESSVFTQCGDIWVRLDFMLRHGRDVHPTWVESLIETLSNTKGLGVLSTRAKSEEDFDSY